MATLALTAVGTLVGGPIGGALGALIGNQIDQRLFAPKGRQGPRLTDLAIQLSRYGQPIPRLFGTMRVAGSVIWSTDLIEDRHKSGGGKGRPSVTTYSYSVSFAVALSARPIRAVHRIWADGKLLRGEAGDWKTELGAFRLHTGEEGQLADPLIATIEGAADAPAYRGIAYAVFEHLELADFANHIPSLTFEVEADDGAVALHEIAAELSDGAIQGSASRSFGGYAAGGDSVRGAVGALTAATGLSVHDDGAVLRITAPDAETTAIDAEALSVRLDVQRTATGLLPDEVAISYYEPARDYQTGLQRARRGGVAHRAESFELAAALDAPGAKALAEARLARAWAERTRRVATMPWRSLHLRPGDLIMLGGRRWRIATRRFEKMAIEAQLVGCEADAGLIPPAAPGRPTTETDQPHGPTILHVMDLPALGSDAQAAPRLWITAAGEQPGWRRAVISTSSDGGLSFATLGNTSAPATCGVALSALGEGSPLLFDDMNMVEVELPHDGMALEGRSDAALFNGANLAVLGDELIQFGVAEQTGANRFRLSRLMRGRRGSEWAIASHVVGERFVLVEAEALLACDLPTTSIGTEIEIHAHGIGDVGDVTAAIVLAGRSVRPPSPVRLKARRLDDGTLRIGWTRRSRTGWGWIDGIDAPLGEESERYRLRIEPDLGVPREVELPGPDYDYDPAAQSEDGASSAGMFAITVWQVGTVAASEPPLTGFFTL